MVPYPGIEAFDLLKGKGEFFVEKGMKWNSKEIFSFSSVYRQIPRRSWVHPLFYLVMNLSFHQSIKKW